MKLPAFLTDQRVLRAVWRVTLDERVCHLVGTAHFFPYRFTRSLEALLEPVDLLLTEGPLDDESLDRIAAHGRDAGDAPRLVDHLDPKAVMEICHVLRRRLGCLAKGRSYLMPPPPGPECFEDYTGQVRPWMALFALWSTCLGWRHSVDREAYDIASRLGKRIEPLETVEEQIEVLDQIPLDRIVKQLNDVSNWGDYTRRYVKGYVACDMEKLQHLQQWYRVRSRRSISDRDRILTERILERLPQQDVVALAGLPHVPGMLSLFRDHGAEVEQVQP